MNFEQQLSSVFKSSYIQIRLCFALAVCALLVGCDSSVPQQPESEKSGLDKQDRPTTAPTASQAPKPEINREVTTALFAAITDKNLGNARYDVRLSPSGISVYPGETPTTVTFDVSELKGGKYQLLAFIAPLPASVLANNAAGIAGVEVSLDGKSLGRKVADRSQSANFPIDLSEARKLVIAVDSSNGTPAWDLLTVGLQEASK